MSDARLRTLERAAAAGDAAAAVELLRAKVRRGQLTAERVELAAYLGHSAARLAAPGVPAQPTSPTRWVEELRRWGWPAALRAALAAARWAWGELPVPASTLEVAEAWLRCPCPTHALALERAALAVVTLESPVPPARRVPDGWGPRETVIAARAELLRQDARLEALRQAVGLAAACASGEVGEVGDAPPVPAEGAGAPALLGLPGPGPAEAGRGAAATVAAALRARADGDRPLRRAVAADLLPWVLAEESAAA